MSRYRVVGNHTFDGVAPGRLVTVDDPIRAHRLIRAGTLAPVTPPKKTEESNGDVRID